MTIFNLKNFSRPETSFAVLTSPLKIFKYIIWGKNKWKFIGFLFIVFLVLFAILSLYTFPVNFTLDFLIQTYILYGRICFKGAMWNAIL